MCHRVTTGLHSLIKYSEQRWQLYRAIIVVLGNDHHRRIESEIPSERTHVELRSEHLVSRVNGIMQICQLPKACRLDLVCLAYSTMQRWRVRVFALVSNEIYLYYQVVRAFQSCNNIYLPRQPRLSSLCTLALLFVP